MRSVMMSAVLSAVRSPGLTWSGTPQPLRVHVTADGAVVRVSGDVDGDGAGALDEVVGQLVGRGGGVVDVSGVTFLPAAVVGLLARHVALASELEIDVRLVARSGTFPSRVLGAVAVTHHCS